MNNAPNRGGSLRRPVGKPGVANRAADATSALRFAELVSLDVDLATARQLNLSSKALTSLPPRLDAMVGMLRKLDLSHNNLSAVDALSCLAQLSNLNLSYNPSLRQLDDLRCPQLAVLTVANCGLTCLSGLEASASTLRTLIANDNDLRIVSPTADGARETKLDAATSVGLRNYNILASLTVCETLVLSRNASLCAAWTAPPPEPSTKVENSGEEDSEEDEERAGRRREEVAARAEQHPLSVMEKLPKLKKLSLASCNLQSLPERWFLPMVTELRLGHNQLTSLQPEGVILRSVKILDVTHNDLTSISTLRRCRFLRQLSLKGNPLLLHYVKCDADEADEDETPLPNPRSLQRAVSAMFKEIQSIDGIALLQPEELRRRPSSNKRTRAAASGDEGEKTSLPPKAKKRTVDPAVIAAEADAKDVVLDVSQGSLASTKATVVRRERAIAPRSDKHVLASGEDAVSQLTKQKSMSDGW